MEIITVMISIIAVLYFLVILPLLLGQFIKVWNSFMHFDWLDSFLWGFLAQLFIFEIFYTPALLLRVSFSKFSNVLMVAYLIFGAVGFCLLVYHQRKKVVSVKVSFHKVWNKKNFLWIFPLVLIGIQLYMNIFYQYLDGDDAYYMAQSTAAVMTDHMYGFEPYTGVTTDLDMRHAMAGLPVFLSFLSKIAQIHPAIMGHTIFSTFIIAIVYLLYGKIAKLLFKGDGSSIPLFLFFIALFQMFGNSTIYTNETFFLTRTSQGKSVFSGFLIPLLFLFLLELSKRMETERFANSSQSIRKNHKYSDCFIRMLLFQVAGVCCTTMSVYLVSLILGMGILILSIRDRKPKMLIYYLVSLIPAGFYGLLYLMN